MALTESASATALSAKVLEEEQTIYKLEQGAQRELHIAHSEIVHLSKMEELLHPELTSARTEAFSEAQLARFTKEQHDKCYKDASENASIMSAMLKREKSEASESAETVVRIKAEVKKGPSLSLVNYHSKMCDMLGIAEND